MALFRYLNLVIAICRQVFPTNGFESQWNHTERFTLYLSVKIQRQQNVVVSIEMTAWNDDSSRTDDVYTGLKARSNFAMGMALGNLVYSNWKKADALQDQCRMLDTPRIGRQEMNVKQHLCGQPCAPSSRTSHSTDNYWTARNAADSKNALVSFSYLFHALLKRLRTQI